MFLGRWEIWAGWSEVPLLNRGWFNNPVVLEALRGSRGGEEVSVLKSGTVYHGIQDLHS